MANGLSFSCLAPHIFAGKKMCGMLSVPPLSSLVRGYCLGCSSYISGLSHFVLLVSCLGNIHLLCTWPMNLGVVRLAQHRRVLDVPCTTPIVTPSNYIYL
ncbi:hypothetical protein SLA2020_261850 [Shorea laevis]